MSGILAYACAGKKMGPASEVLQYLSDTAVRFAEAAAKMYDHGVSALLDYSEKLQLPERYGVAQHQSYDSVNLQNSLPQSLGVQPNAVGNYSQGQLGQRLQQMEIDGELKTTPALGQPQLYKTIADLEDKIKQAKELLV